MTNHLKNLLDNEEKLEKEYNRVRDIYEQILQNEKYINEHPKRKEEAKRQIKQVDEEIQNLRNKTMIVKRQINERKVELQSLEIQRARLKGLQISLKELRCFDGDDFIKQKEIELSNYSELMKEFRLRKKMISESVRPPRIICYPQKAKYKIQHDQSKYREACEIDLATLKSDLDECKRM